MENHILITGLFYFIMILVAIFLLIYLLYEVGKKQKAKDDKPEDIERLRDKLTEIEVKRLESEDEFSPVNVFGK